MKRRWNTGFGVLLGICMLLILAGMPLQAAEKEVASIEYERAIPYTAWLESDFNYDEGTGEYYCNGYNDTVFGGDTLTVTYMDDTVTTYRFDWDEYVFVSESDPEDTLSAGEDVTVNMSDYISGWKLEGGENYYTVSYGGATCMVPVEVKSTPVAEIEYKPGNRYHYLEEYNSYRDGWYGDQVIVTYKDETTETFNWEEEQVYTIDEAYGGGEITGCFVGETSGKVVPPRSEYNVFETMSVYYDGAADSCRMTYMGVSDTVTNLNYFARGIRFEQAKERRLREGTGDSSLQTDENGEEYWEYELPWYTAFTGGDKLIVTYENAAGDTQEITYVKQTEGDWSDSFMPEDPTVDNYIYAGYVWVDVPDQSTEHLIAGETYEWNVTWFEDYDDENPRFTSEGGYHVRVQGQDPITIEDPGTIENVAFRSADNWGLYFNFDPYTDPEGNTIHDYQIRGSIDGKTVTESSAWWSEDNPNPQATANAQILPLLEANPGMNQAYTVDFVIEALNEDGDIVAKSETFDFTMTVTGYEKKEGTYTLPEQIRMGNGSWADKTVYGRFTYTWTGSYDSSGTFSSSMPVGKVTEVKSSNTAVLEVSASDYDDFRFIPKKAGTAKVTVTYSEDGRTKTMTQEVKVVDRYLQVIVSQDGTLQYMDIGAGQTGKVVCGALLHIYNAKTGEYEFAGDVTDQTTFAVDGIGSENEAGADLSSKVHTKISGSTLTYTTDSDIPNAWLYFEVKASCGEATGTGGFRITVLQKLHLIYPQDGFLFPLPGKSAKLSLTMKETEGGKTVEKDPAYYTLSFSNVTVKDSSGAELASGLDKKVLPSQLPLTLTNNADSDGNANIRIQAYDAQDTYLSWLTFYGSDIFRNLTVSIPKDSYAYTGKAQKPAVTLTYGKDKISLDDYTITYLNNTDIGTATVKISPKDRPQDFHTKTFKIVPKAPKISALTPQTKGFKVTWSKVAGVTGYKVYRNNKLVKTIKSASTVTYLDAAAKTNGTKYTYKVYAYKTVNGAAYTSAASAAKSSVFLTVPALGSAKNTAAKTVTVKWSKNAKAAGYQIQYATNAKFTGAKSVKVKKAATVSQKITKLTKGKTWYFRIRAYKGSDYSAWSAAKKVKVSK